MTTDTSRRVLRNFGVVLRGRGIAAIFNLGATALMAHALPATQFGLVILVHTYVLAVRGILNFRTFEAIVRFGVPMHENGDNAGLRKLLRTTSLIDLTSAVVATPELSQGRCFVFPLYKRLQIPLGSTRKVPP